MLKKIWHKITGGKNGATAKKTIPQGQCRITKKHISPAAGQAVSRLQEAGYEAYIVGGAIRDLLIGKTPKDYDIATNATPSEIRALFKRSRIIGRRFPIVHIVIGRETIEAATFRSGGEIVQNAQGRIMKDNGYGTLDEDAQRRDFTCNALYFDPVKGEITDFHNGVEDILARRLVIIGEPAERYREDPVRILRAVRLSAKLDFAIEETTAAPIPHYAERLKDEPSARLFDEIQKVLQSGYAGRCLEQFRLLNIPPHIHPLLDALLQAAGGGRPDIINATLKNTDERVRTDKSVSIGFILACLMWDGIDSLWQKHIRHGAKPAPAMGKAITELKETATTEKGWGIPQKFIHTMHEIWILQPQFQNRCGARPYRLLAQERFRAAYDFLVLRTKFGQADKELADWWDRFQHADQEQRAAMIHEQHTIKSQANAAQGQRKKRKKTAKKTENKSNLTPPPSKGGD